MMKIYYEQIKEETLKIETNLYFEEDNDKFNIIEFKGDLSKAGSAYILNGKMYMKFSCLCDRCLEEIIEDYKEKIVVTLSPLDECKKIEKNQEEGLSDEEVGLYITDKDSFDLHELLREEALLLVPDKRLCHEKCKGICSICGKLLNKEKCTCEKEINFSMSALKELKNLK